MYYLLTTPIPHCSALTTPTPHFSLPIRLREYFQSVLDTPSIGIVPPVPGASGKDVRRDERCGAVSCAVPCHIGGRIT